MLWINKWSINKSFFLLQKVASFCLVVVLMHTIFVTEIYVFRAIYLTAITDRQNYASPRLTYLWWSGLSIAENATTIVLILFHFNPSFYIKRYLYVNTTAHTHRTERAFKTRKKNYSCKTWQFNFCCCIFCFFSIHFCLQHIIWYICHIHFVYAPNYFFLCFLIGRFVCMLEVICLTSFLIKIRIVKTVFSLLLFLSFRWGVVRLKKKPDSKKKTPTTN